MTDSQRAQKAAIRQRSVVPRPFPGSVILIVPDGRDADTLTRILTTLLQPAAAANRYLIRVADDATAARLVSCWPKGCRAQILSNVDLPGLDDADVELCRMPPGSTAKETNDLALAMTDAYLVKSGKAVGLQLRAGKLGKMVVEHADLLKPLAPHAAQPLEFGRLHYADHRGVSAFVVRQPGRIERFIVELMAYCGCFIQALWDCLRRRKTPFPSLTDTAKGIRGALWRGWGNYRTFMDEDEDEEGKKTLAGLCPTKAATQPDAVQLAQFARLDAAARTGARLQRDIIWIAYGLSTLAVCAALSSWTKLHGIGWLAWVKPEAWAYIELVSLFVVVALIGWIHSTRLQQRWMALRVTAEQLRCVILCVPLCIAPKVLTTHDRPEKSTDVDSERWTIMINVLAAVKRAARDQGLAALQPGYDAAKAAEWVSCFMFEQEEYHRGNQRKLHGVEYFVRVINTTIFIAVMLFVLAHIALEYIPGAHKYAEWFGGWFVLLFVSAAGPAIAAALHGATGRLNIVDRKEMSEQSAAKLHELDAKLKEWFEKTPRGEATRWTAVRQTALSAGVWMSGEADDWFKTMLLEEMTLP